MLYSVTIDATAFTRSEAASECEMSPRKLKKFVSARRKAGTLPVHVLDIIRVGCSAEDGKEDGEYKCFASVVLKMDRNAEDWVGLPREIVAMLNELIDLAPRRMRADGSNPLDVEQNSWEVLSADEIDEATA